MAIRPPTHRNVTRWNERNRILKTMIAQYAQQEHHKWGQNPPRTVPRMENTRLEISRLRITRRVMKRHQTGIWKSCKSHGKYGKYHDLHRREWTFRLGVGDVPNALPVADKVMAKLAPEFWGTYEVIRVDSSVVFRLRPVLGGRMITSHVKNLKPAYLRIEAPRLRQYPPS
ncbi:hypothetical protein JTB14_033202 [Gonioctena quinquepunctata]|nr:hypothetical protein JTB14_033202 [Gonioctena quinquepunctata]